MKRATTARDATTRCLEAGAQIILLASHQGAIDGVTDADKLADVEFEQLDEMIVARIAVPRFDMVEE